MEKIPENYGKKLKIIQKVKILTKFDKNLKNVNFFYKFQQFGF